MSTKTSIGLKKPDMNDTVSDLVNNVGAIADFLDMIFPVGAIWMCAGGTNPNNIFPGTTWIKVEGRFLLGSSSTHGAMTTGGEESHKLTVGEMPAHGHSAKWSKKGDWIGAWKSDASGGSKWDVATTWSNGDPKTGSDWVSITDTGGNQAHNNMPPYYTVNIWRRTI